MPVQPTYPGVYIEELPSGVRTIIGVSTSVTAFVGVAKRGPVNKAVHILSFGDYERYFGGLSSDSPMSYAVNQFYLNGGSDAWVVRLAKNAARAALPVKDTGGKTLFTINALDEGTSGNDIQIETAPNELFPHNFDIKLTYVSRDNPADSRIETYRNVSLNPESSRYIEDVINDVSRLVTVMEEPTVASDEEAAASGPSGAGASSGTGSGPSGSSTPAGSGTEASGTSASGTGAAGASGTGASGTSATSGTSGTSTSSTGTGTAGTAGTPTSTALTTTTVTLPAAIGPMAGALTSSAFADKDLDKLPDATHNSFMLSIDGDAPTLITLDSSAASGNDLGSKLDDIAGRIQKAVRTKKPGMVSYRKFTCTADKDNKQLVLTSGTIDSNSSVVVTAPPSNSIAKELHLLDGKSLQGGSPTLVGGKGDPFTSDEAFSIFFGDRLKREGIYALEEIDLFNLLCLPGMTDAGILAEAISYCRERRAFLIVDAPQGLQPADMVDYINGPNLPKGDFGTYAALYYPWVKAPDPLNNGKLRSFPPSGLMAGLYARTDSSRGVWKAPAGTEATLVGVRGVDYLMTDLENGTLNPHGVNCLRIFPVYGPVCWGSRTVSGDDQIASDYKYVPIRRLTLYIEESLYRGTKWVVFEPNDEPLWSQIRLNVGAFMHNLFRQGAFQGQTPREAYLVKCDRETTTQNDIDQGIVNILVAFAPLKPAEFVVIQIQQLAGQIQV